MTLKIFPFHPETPPYPIEPECFAYEKRVLTSAGDGGDGRWALSGKGGGEGLLVVRGGAVEIRRKGGDRAKANIGHVESTRLMHIHADVNV